MQIESFIKTNSNLFSIVHVECSSKEGQNVEKVFKKLVKLAEREIWNESLETRFETSYKKKST